MNDYVQSTDIYITGFDAFDIPGAFDTLTITAGVRIESVDQDGVLSNQNGNVLINDGNILATKGDGVRFVGNDGGITNLAGRSIIGGNDGIFMLHDGNSVANSGLVMGLTGTGIELGFFSTSCSVANYGDVYGRVQGVLANGHYDGGTIVNAGLIRSDQVGIYVDTKLGLTTSITNQPHATISGASHSIFTLFGGISLNNLGTLVGDVVCATANEVDAIVNNGTIIGNVFLGAGNETYNGKGGGVVTGGIYGGPTNDFFIAGPAKETFFAGTGAASFVFDKTRFSPATAKHDIIHNFNPANGDRIYVQGIDADVTHRGHQHFVFIGTQTFAHFHSLHPSVVGMLRFDHASQQLQGNVNAHFSDAEFEVALPGVGAIHVGDLIMA
jgi:hypothetical protein